MANYYLNTIPGVRYERYAFFDGGASTVILENDTAYSLSPNTRTQQQVIDIGGTSISESAYNTYVDDVESFARIGNHPPTKPPSA